MDWRGLKDASAKLSSRTMSREKLQKLCDHRHQPPGSPSRSHPLRCSSCSQGDRNHPWFLAEFARQLRRVEAQPADYFLTTVSRPAASPCAMSSTSGRSCTRAVSSSRLLSRQYRPPTTPAELYSRSKVGSGPPWPPLQTYFGNPLSARRPLSFRDSSF